MKLDYGKILWEAHIEAFHEHKYYPIPNWNDLSARRRNEWRKMAEIFATKIGATYE